MPLSLRARRVLAALTLVNFVFPPLWVAGLFALALALPPGDAEPGPLLSAALLSLFALAVGFGVFSLGLQVYYLVHLLRNPLLARPVRNLLGLGLVFMPLVVMPLYYFIYVWRAPAREAGLVQSF